MSQPLQTNFWTNYWKDKCPRKESAFIHWMKPKKSSLCFLYVTHLGSRHERKMCNVRFEADRNFYEENDKEIYSGLQRASLTYLFVWGRSLCALWTTKRHITKTELPPGTTCLGLFPSFGCTMPGIYTHVIQMCFRNFWKLQIKTKIRVFKS